MVSLSFLGKSWGLTELLHLSNVSKKSIVFCIGHPRSGLTALHEAFSSINAVDFRALGYCEIFQDFDFYGHEVEFFQSIESMSSSQMPFSFREAACDVINSFLANECQLGFLTDTRLCKSISQWQSLLDETYPDIDYCFIWLYRDPFETCHSLARNASIRLDLGRKIWLLFMERMNCYVGNDSSTFISYDNLLIDPASLFAMLPFCMLNLQDQEVQNFYEAIQPCKKSVYNYETPHLFHKQHNKFIELTSQYCTALCQEQGLAWQFERKSSPLKNNVIDPETDLHLNVEMSTSKIEQGSVVSIPHRSIYNASDFYSLSKQNSITLLSPIDIILLQYSGTEFHRYDVLARILLLRAWDIGHNDEPLKVYEMMQKTRVNRNTTERFKILYKNFKLLGFKLDHPIPLTPEGKLIDGSHRLACALHFGCKLIPVQFVAHKNIKWYGVSWFYDNGFDVSFIENMRQTLHDVLN